MHNPLIHLVIMLTGIFCWWAGYALGWRMRREQDLIDNRSRPMTWDSQTDMLTDLDKLFDR